MFVIRVGIVALACCGVFPCACAWAASGENAYVTVSCATAGTDDVVPKGADFYVTTRGVDAANFCADIEVKAHSPYYLVSPEDGRLRCRIGGGGGYEVRDESGTEDSFSGAVEVLKLDIEPVETNICWKSTSCMHPQTDTGQPSGRSGRLVEQPSGNQWTGQFGDIQSERTVARRLYGDSPFGRCGGLQGYLYCADYKNCDRNEFANTV